MCEQLKFIVMESVFSSYQINHAEIFNRSMAASDIFYSSKP